MDNKTHELLDKHFDARNKEWAKRSGDLKDMLAKSKAFNEDFAVLDDSVISPTLQEFAEYLKTKSYKCTVSTDLTEMTPWSRLDIEFNIAKTKLSLIVCGFPIDDSIALGLFLEDDPVFLPSSFPEVISFKDVTPEYIEDTVARLIIDGV